MQLRVTEVRVLSPVQEGDRVAEFGTSMRQGCGAVLGGSAGM